MPIARQICEGAPVSVSPTRLCAAVPWRWSIWLHECRVGRCQCEPAGCCKNLRSILRFKGKEKEVKKMVARGSLFNFFRLNLKHKGFAVRLILSFLPFTTFSLTLFTYTFFFLFQNGNNFTAAVVNGFQMNGGGAVLCLGFDVCSHFGRIKAQRKKKGGR